MSSIKIPKYLKYFLPVFVVITAMSGLIYLAVQQNYRQSANDPQIQLTEDAAAKLNSGNQTSLVIPHEEIDVAASLAPFVIIYNDQGQVVNSSAVLHGQAPVIPTGVFDSVRSGGEKRFTWQPESGVRIASVVTNYNKGFVLAGRSLKEVEKREDGLTLVVFLGWLTTNLVSLALFFVLSKFKTQN